MLFPKRTIATLATFTLSHEEGPGSKQERWIQDSYDRMGPDSPFCSAWLTLCRMKLFLVLGTGIFREYSHQSTVQVLHQSWLPLQYAIVQSIPVALHPLISLHSSFLHSRAYSSCVSASKNHSATALSSWPHTVPGPLYRNLVHWALVFGCTDVPSGSGEGLQSILSTGNICTQFLWLRI